VGATSSADAGDLGNPLALQEVAVIEEADGILTVLLIASSQFEADAIAIELRRMGRRIATRTMGAAGR
jgi:hypothetical protein